MPDLETTRRENLPPKEKVIVQMQKKANKRSDRVDLKGKLRIPSVNLRPTQLVFSCPFYRSSTLTSRSSTLRTLIFPRKKTYTYKKNGEGAKTQLNIIESRSCSCTDHPDNFGSSLVSQFSWVCSSTASVDLVFTYRILPACC